MNPTAEQLQGEAQAVADPLPAVNRPSMFDIPASATMGTGVPSWALEYLVKWRDILFLNAWGISVSLDKVVGGDEQTKAMVDLYPNVWQAIVTIKDTLPATLEGLEPGEIAFWQKCIIHELIHVFMAGITDFVERTVVSNLSPAAAQMGLSSFTREVEPVVELLSHILFELERS